MKTPFFVGNLYETVFIEADEDTLESTAFTSAGDRIGKVAFEYKDDEYAPGGCYLLLSHAVLEEMGDRYLGHGIGTECVKLMKDATGYEVAFVANDYQRHDNRPYYVGNGWDFVKKLERHKLAFQL